MTTITMASLTGATDDEAVKITAALALVNKAWGSPELQAKVLAAVKLDGTPGFESTDDSPQQVWNNMQAAGAVAIDDEVYTPGWFQRRFDNDVVGYEDTDGSVHENSTFIDEYTPAEVANNLAHETCHKLGYSHDFDATPQRPFSQPYQIGDMVEAVCEAWDAAEAATPGTDGSIDTAIQS